MKKLDVSQRDKVKELYGTVPLFDMISSRARKYALPPYKLRSNPEDIFQMVVAWIDRIKTEPSDEKAAKLMAGAWDEQWGYFADMAEMARVDYCDNETEELTCLVLSWLWECLALLSDERVHGNLVYLRLADGLLAQLVGHTLRWVGMRKEILAVCSEGQGREALMQWLVDYVDDTQPPVTTVQGSLVLQPGDNFLSPPSGKHDPKMYSKEAQKIWRMLVKKEWCEKQNSMLVWKKSKLSFGYMVKIVADKLQVYDPLREDTIVWSSFKEIFKDLDESILRQARTGATKVGKNIPVKKWPADAQELNTWMKTLQ